MKLIARIEQQAPGYVFDSLGEHFAHDWRYERADMKAALALMPEAGTVPRELLQTAADELKVVKLNEAAHLVAATAIRCPAMTDLRYCDYCTQEPYRSSPDNGANITAWLQAEQRHAERIRRRGRELLRRRRLDPNWQDKL